MQSISTLEGPVISRYAMIFVDYTEELKLIEETFDKHKVRFAVLMPTVDTNEHAAWMALVVCINAV